MDLYQPTRATRTDPQTFIDLKAFADYLRLDPECDETDELELFVNAAIGYHEHGLEQDVLRRERVLKLPGLQTNLFTIFQGPVISITSLTIHYQGDDNPTVIDPSLYMLLDQYRPAKLVLTDPATVSNISTSVMFPIELTYESGMDSPPPLLTQSVQMLAASYYENRTAESGQPLRPVEFGIDRHIQTLKLYM